MGWTDAQGRCEEQVTNPRSGVVCLPLHGRASSLDVGSLMRISDPIPGDVIVRALRRKKKAKLWKRFRKWLRGLIGRKEPV